MPRTDRARSQPDGRDHRQPERQERGKGENSIDLPGYDAGKKIKGKKRHVLVDTQGLLLHAIIHSADIQDRDGGVLLRSAVFGAYPFLLKLYADSGYQGPKFRDGLAAVCQRINVEIAKRSDVGKFVVLPKRWIVERTIAWLNRCRRLARDWECLNRNGLAFLRWASIRRKLHALRKQIPEPVFGIIQSALGFRQFLLRGLDNVRGEWNLVTMAYNVKRLFACAGAA
jgi:transposase